MEFNQKLQKLRKQRGLTQEELAESLYVSRTAISKWESGRGYPSIDSLKAIAKFFSVSVDTLICASEAISIVEEDKKRRDMHFCTVFFGLVDVIAALFLFLPLFGFVKDGEVQISSLIALDGARIYLKIAYYTVTVAHVLMGIVTLALQSAENPSWLKMKAPISLAIGVSMVLVFIVSSQPYAAVLAFALLAVKIPVLIRSKI